MKTIGVILKWVESIIAHKCYCLTQVQYDLSLKDTIIDCPIFAMFC